MTKALLCAACFDIRGLPPDGSEVTCRCGNSTARWLDPHAGTVRAKAIDKSKVRMIGINNRFLEPACSSDRRPRTNEEWRQLHDHATEAPGYLFDESMRSCWAIIFRIGEAAGVDWEADEA